jgi:NTE family protein
MLETAFVRRVIAFVVVVVATVAFSVSAPAGPTPETCAPLASVPVQVPTGLVLSGGGAKGAWEAGVAAALVEAGLPIALVAGSSAGALNAAMIAGGRTGRLEALWRGVDRGNVYSLRAPIVFAGLLPGWLTLLALDRAGSLLDPAPLRELIAASVEIDRIRASPMRLLVTATDLERRDKVVFDNATVTIDALAAAVAVPGAFPAVEVNGALLVDGGLTGRAPVLDALEAGVALRRVIVVMSYAPDERGRRPTTMRAAVEEAFEMGMIHQIRRDTELARLRYPGVDVVLITPSSALLLRPLEFDAAGIARALALGRADARACLAAFAATTPRRESPRSR